jgi:hypothetical protein
MVARPETRQEKMSPISENFRTPNVPCQGVSGANFHPHSGTNRYARLNGEPEVIGPDSQFLISRPNREVVNTPLPPNVYHLLRILRAWPGPATKVTCSRQAFDLGL